MDPERKAAFTPVDDPKVVDDELTKAAAAAVDEVVNAGIPAEDPVEDPAKIIKEVDDEPDHKARSDLGRKFSALHRRQDDFDQKIDRLLEALTKQKEPEFEEEDDIPMTKAEAKEYFRKLKQDDYQETTAQKTKHQNDYDGKMVELSSEYDDAESNAIFEELMTMRYDPTSDGARDAEMNFLKAERAYLRKKTAAPVKKDVPLKKDPVTGVITSQKTVSRESAPVKLNSAGESYLKFVALKDGDEKAQNLRKGL